MGGQKRWRRLSTCNYPMSPPILPVSSRQWPLRSISDISVSSISYTIHHGYIMFTHVSGRTHSQHTNQCIDLAIEPTIDHIHLFKPDFWPWTHLRTLRAIRALHAIRVHPSESIPANPSLQVPILAISHTNGVIRGTLDACCKFASQFVSHIPTFPSGTPYLQGLFSCRLHCNSTTVSWPFFSPT